MENIDFIISWVDANDPKWQRKHDRALGKPRFDDSNENVGDERFRDYGTLKYVLRSMQKYAPWVHHIFLVTDDQRPSWLREEVADKNAFGAKLTVVDHKEIIDSKYLPCFNSNTIEFNMTKIKGLSEHFVIFNDDMLINKPVTPEDFFDGDKPRDFRIYQPLRPYSDYDHILFNNNQLINHWLNGKYLSKFGMLSRVYGHQLIKNLYHLYLEPRHQVSNYVLAHNAQAFRKSAFNEVLQKWHDAILTTYAQSFRSNLDVSTLLVRNYELERGNFTPRSPQFGTYFTLNQYQALAQELRDKKHALYCINDTVVEDYDTAASAVQSSLAAAYPEKSDFEK
jgi:hypothetical protein